MPSWLVEPAPRTPSPHRTELAQGLRMLATGMPLLITGPAGSGKSVAARRIAEASGLPVRTVAGGRSPAVPAPDRPDGTGKDRSALVVDDAELLDDDTLHGILASHLGPLILTARTTRLRGDSPLALLRDDHGRRPYRIALPALGVDETVALLEDEPRLTGPRPHDIITATTIARIAAGSLHAVEDLSGVARSHPERFPRCLPSPVLFPPTAVDSVERVTLPPLTPGQELAAAVLHRLGPQSYRAASRHVGDDAVDALIQHGVLRPLDDGMIQVAPLIGATLRLRHDAPVEELRRSALLLAAAWNRGETLSPDELVLLAEMELSPGALRDAGLLTARAAAIAHQQGAHAEARALLATAEATAPRRTAVVRAFAEAVRTASDTQPLRLVDGERQADGVAEDDDPVLHRNECYLRGIIRSWSAHPASPRALTAPETVIELWSEQEPYSVGADADATLSRIAADPATDSSTRCWALALALGASAHRDDRRRVEELLPLARHTRREHTSAGWVPEDYYAADADAVLWLTIRLVVQLSGAAESHPDDGWGGAAWTATAPGGPDSRIRRTGAYVLRALDALASGREDIVVANVERLLRSLTRHSFAGLNRTIIHICRWITLPETLLPPDRRGVPRTRRRNAELDGVADALALAEQASSPARPVGEPQTPEWMLTLAEFRLALAEDGYWLRLADGLPPIDGATEPPTVAALLSALRSSLRDDEEIALICDRLVAQRNPLAAAHVLELGRRLAIADGREETALACAIWRDRLGFRARDDAGVGVGAAGGRRVASSPFDAAERAAASTVAGPLPPVAPTWAPPASPSGPRSGRADEDPRPVDGARRTRPSATVPGPRSELSAREKEICGLIALGLRNKEIAARLHLSVRTVESHVLQARSKLGARRRTDIPSLLRAENELSANS